MPVIWLIDAYRGGERGQVRALVDALGWPCETKVLSYRSHVFLPHVLGQSTLRGITAGSAAKLVEPIWEPWDGTTMALQAVGSLASAVIVGTAFALLGSIHTDQKECNF